MSPAPSAHIVTPPPHPRMTPSPPTLSGMSYIPTTRSWAPDVVEPLGRFGDSWVLDGEQRGGDVIEHPLQDFVVG